MNQIKTLPIQLGLHILALNEIQIDPLYPKELTCKPDCEQVRLDESNHGGGAAIYIKDSIMFNHKNKFGLMG